MAACSGVAAASGSARGNVASTGRTTIRLPAPPAVPFLQQIQHRLASCGVQQNPHQHFAVGQSDLPVFEHRMLLEKFVDLPAVLLGQYHLNQSQRHRGGDPLSSRRVPPSGRRRSMQILAWTDFDFRTARLDLCPGVTANNCRSVLEAADGGRSAGGCDEACRRLDLGTHRARRELIGRQRGRPTLFIRRASGAPKSR